MFSGVVINTKKIEKMNNLKINHRGFSHHFVLFFFLVIFAITGIGYKVATNAATKSEQTNTYLIYSNGGKYKYVRVWGEGRCGTKTIKYSTGSKSNALVLKTPAKDSKGQYPPIKLVCTANKNDKLSISFDQSSKDTNTLESFRSFSVGDDISNKCIFLHDTGVSRIISRENGSCKTTPEIDTSTNSSDNGGTLYDPASKPARKSVTISVKTFQLTARTYDITGELGSSAGIKKLDCNTSSIRVSIADQKNKEIWAISGALRIKWNSKKEKCTFNYKAKLFSSDKYYLDKGKFAVSVTFAGNETLKPAKHKIFYREIK